MAPPNDSEKTQPKIIYLACPYSDPDPRVREERFKAATEAAAALISDGYIVYSPITMTHPIDLVLAGGQSTLGSDYWVAFDEAFMSLCSEIFVLQLPGWNMSAGIERELQYFRDKRRPIRYLKPAKDSYNSSRWSR